MKLTKEELERFWEKVDKTETCWFWTAYVDPNGYGQINFRGKKNNAHFISWIVHNGSISGDVSKKCQIKHSCENKHCVNPDHLYENNLLRRIYSKTVLLGDCLLWTGHVTSKHHNPAISYNGARDCSVRRVVWELETGMDADRYDRFITICDNKLCVKFGHILRYDPIDDPLYRKYKPKTKLTESDVEYIRDSDLSRADLSEMFEICKRHVSGIRNGERRC